MECKTKIVSELALCQQHKSCCCYCLKKNRNEPTSLGLCTLGQNFNKPKTTCSTEHNYTSFQYMSQCIQHIIHTGEMCTVTRPGQSQIFNNYNLPLQP